MANPIPQPVVTVNNLASFQSTNVAAYADGGAQLAYLQGTTTELDGGEAFYQRIDGDFSSASNPPTIIVDAGGNRWQKTTQAVVPLPLTVANGGTGVATIPTGALMVGAGTSPITSLALGTGVGTWLTTPSSANLLAAVTDETGTGSLVFATSPTLVTPLLGTPTSGVLTNCTGYPVANLANLGAGVATFLATPSSANFLAALTDKTGTGVNVFATSPTLVTPVLGEASATSLAFSSTSGIIGTTTNDNAAAGSVGQIIEGEVLVGSALNLPSATSTDVTSISLTAGDWDVWGTVVISAASGTLVTNIVGWISATSATLPTIPNKGAYAQLQTAFGATTAQILPVGQMRVSVSGTTTIYLTARAIFTVSTATVYGYIAARRVR